MTLTVGSLFSGIGGLELGLEWARLGPVVWQVEQDAYCRRVLERHWPDALRFEDVRDVGAHNLPPVDVICGGFPCQDISYAGKGAGLAGERSGLWYEFARIVRELGPRVVVVENVRALLTRGLDAVLGTLADCGYDAEWSVLSAADVGAPHLRERVFVLAYADRPGLEGRNGASVRERAGERALGSCGASVAAAAGELRERSGREQAGGRPDPTDGRWWLVEPAVGRVAHGIPARVDRLRALGNAVVPQCAEVVGRRLLEIDAERRGEEAAA